MSGTKQRNFGLDVLRAAAVSFVVLAHAFTFFSPWFDFRWLYGLGTMGVDLFFALSGFLIGRLLLSPSFLDAGWPGLSRFWSRRWLRTLPAYYACLIALVVLHSSRGFHWTQVLFLQNFVPGALALFPVSWSLAIEEWFYLTLPLALLAFGRTRTGWVLMAYILVPPVMRAVGHDAGVTDWAYGARTNIPMRMDSLGFGVLAARLFLDRRELVRWAQSSWLAWILTGVVLAGSFAWTSMVSAYAAEPLSMVTQTLMFSLNGMACAGVVLLFERFRVERSRLITVVALISYSVYLTHFEVFSYFNLYWRSTGVGEAILSCVIALAISFGVSYLLYVAVERPFMALRDRGMHPTVDVQTDADGAPTGFR
jgi:peptidoglycan/LPS O-acetylase OafA/YrhL